MYGYVIMSIVNFLKKKGKCDKFLFDLGKELCEFIIDFFKLSKTLKRGKNKRYFF